jgi:hypothetical protein
MTDDRGPALASWVRILALTCFAASALLNASEGSWGRAAVNVACLVGFYALFAWQDR